MIDNHDKQTQPLPLEQKRSRGRPATGQALSNAERQRRYREAQKAQRDVNMRGDALEEVEKLREMARAEFKRAEGLQAQVVDMALKIAQLENKITELEIAHLEHKVRQLEQSAKPSRLNQGMKKIIQDVHEVADELDGSTWRIQKKKGAKGKWSTLKGSYWQEARAHDALLDLPECEGAIYRIVEVKSEVED